MKGRQAVAVCVLLVGASGASAHDGGVTGHAALTVADNVLRYELTLSALPEPVLAASSGDTARGLARARDAVRTGLAIRNAGEPCAAASASATPPTAARASVQITVDFVCAGAITSIALRDDSFDRFGADLHVLGRATAVGATQTFTLADEAREVQLNFAAVGAAPRAASGFGAFFVLGIEHILLGYDHLLFLFALLLAPARWQAVVKIVTAFTLAHSVTLALTALDVLRLPSVLVEAVIAASIAYVAAENLWARNPLSRRVWVTPLFGLVHGCGFASVLRDIGLPAGGLWPALIGFNVGVEAGQIAVILLVLPLLHGIRRLPRATGVSAMLSAGVCTVGVWLLLERVV